MSKIKAIVIKGEKVEPIVKKLSKAGNPVEKATEVTTPKKALKKALRQEVYNTLETTFADIKKAVGEKKFNKQVKKASKVLTAGAIKNVKKEKTIKKEKQA